MSSEYTHIMEAQRDRKEEQKNLVENDFESYVENELNTIRLMVSQIVGSSKDYQGYDLTAYANELIEECK